MSKPTIFEAAGGSPAFEALTVRFYDKVKADPLLPWCSRLSPPSMRNMSRSGSARPSAAPPDTPRSMAAIARCLNGTAIWAYSTTGMIVRIDAT
jgi:Bacterial-like globin